jgi:DNA-binding GntR family transcriptional regulator
MSHRFYRADDKSSHSKVVTACEQHDQLIEAIQSRQAARSVAITLQHWELSRNEIDKYVLPDPLPIDAEAVLEGNF